MQIVFINDRLKKDILLLDRSTKAKFTRLCILLSEYNGILKMPHTKILDHNLYELRIRGKQEVRIFYCIYNSQFYLLSYFIKTSNKTPRSELEKARIIKDKLTKR